MVKFVVLTTINDPTRAVKELTKWKDWRVVVVGDRKTPRWDYPGVEFLDVKEGEIENTYRRKNYGYEYAISEGAEVIFETDDDNFPFIGAQAAVERVLESSGDRLRSESGYLNIYRHFGASCWPRGLPLRHIRTEGEKGKDSKPWAVMQFVVNGDPDVDAIYRLTNGSQVEFDSGKCFLLDEGTLSPWNSQCTLWKKEAFPYIKLPDGVTDRVTDILRSYMATKRLWRDGYCIGFSSPVMHQKRNPHDLMKDFREEALLYDGLEEFY